MAINKNFVIKNGAEINTKLFVADANTQKIGIGTTSASYDLHVFGASGNGGIGATYANVTGITTTQALNVLGVSTFNAGPILVARGELTGTSAQSLQVGTATTVSGVYVSGNIGVGQTLPNAKLEVVPTASGIAGLFSGTTSGDMVRITQLGSGNALVVEDSSNPDSTSVVVSGLGSVGIGTSFPRFLLDVDVTTSTGTTAVYVRGDVKITGDLSVDDLILDQASLTTLEVTGFSTLGSFSAANARFAGITTGINAPGINTLGFVSGTLANFSGISTLGFVQHTTLNVTGFSTLGSVSAGNVTLAGIATGINAPGINTLGFVSGTLANFTGISTLGFVQHTTLNVTGFSTLGSLSAGNVTLAGVTTGINAPGINTLGFVQSNTVNVSGFSTLGSISAGNIILAGIATGINAPGISTFGDTTISDLFLAGITTGLNASGISTLSFLTGQSANYTGISTLTSLTGTNVNYSGIGTIANLGVTNLNVSGITTTDNLVVTTTLDVYDADATFHGNVTIDGNLSIGGTSTIINAAQLRIEDKDIILGFTTSQTPNNDTANHGGVAVASTEGFPLVSLQVAGINTLPDTYKQIMWVKENTMGAGTTAAWLFNYSVGIGSTQVPNNVRLAVGAVQVTEDAINARVGNLTHLRSTNINATGITTTNSLSIDATQVISSARQLQNIASLDAVTTATIESAISNAPNSFTDLSVTGFSTLGAASATLLNVSGVATFQSNVHLGDNDKLYFGDGNDLEIYHNGSNSFITDAGIGNLYVQSDSGSVNIRTSTTENKIVANQSGSVDLYYANLGKKFETTGYGATVFGTLQSQQLNVTGVSTLGQANITGLSNAGVSTLGNATASTLVVSGVTTVGVVTGATSIQAGVFYGDGSKLQNISAGVGIQSAGNVVGYGVTTLNFIGIGNTFAYNPATNTVDVSIRGGGGSSGFATYIAGIATASSVGVNTSNLDDPDLTGIGNSFKGLYVGNGMIIVDNQLNGDHYIGTNFNGLMAGPVTINGTLTVDGNYVVV